MRAFVVSSPGNDYHTRLGSCNWFDRRRDRDPNFLFAAAVFGTSILYSICARAMGNVTDSERLFGSAASPVID
jgi:hypothetical protein